MSLTIVVLFIIGAGINVQLRAFDRGRARVERAQLARVLLHRMSDDLRGLMLPEAPATDDAAGTSSSGASSGTSSGASSGTSGEQAGESGEEAGEEAAAIDELASAMTGDDTLDSDLDTLLGTTIESAPGVYGELDWLRIDVVRTTRSDGDSVQDAATATDGVAPVARAARGIESIVYYVVTPDRLATAALATTGEKPAGGLVRRELVRPAVAYASESGDFEYRDTSLPPLASEVTAVEFRYHDGTDWLDAWDTDEMGELPKAIEIRLFLSPIPSRAAEAEPGLAADSQTDDAAIVSRLVVRIPFHEIEDASSETTSAESESSETTSAGSESTETASGGTSP